MRSYFTASLIAAGLALAAPAASAAPAVNLARSVQAEAPTVLHLAAGKHHKRHYKRRGCRLAYGALICGGGHIGNKHRGGFSGHRVGHHKKHGGRKH